MVFVQCSVFVMLRTGMDMLALGILPIIIYTVTYLFISSLSNAIKDAFLDIANSLYCSKWYWMTKNDQKSLLTVMIVAQQPHSLVVSIFADANLERFTEVAP